MLDTLANTAFIALVFGCLAGLFWVGFKIKNILRPPVVSDWCPQIVVIQDVVKHPYADALDICTVLGDYPVITRLGEYKVGDLASYIPIDSIVPDTEQFYFLCPKVVEHYEENGEVKTRQAGPRYEVGSVPDNYRTIYAKNIRGVYSQGMLAPPIPGLSVGDSIVKALQLTKMVEEEDDNISLKMKRGRARKAPNGWEIPYYGVGGLRQYIQFLSPDEEIVLLEKINGSQFSATYHNNDFWVKSRNIYKRIEDIDDFWVGAARRYDLKDKLKNYPGFIFFGELYGAVKNFKYDIEVVGKTAQYRIRFFDIFDIRRGIFLDYDDFVSIIESLELESVPLLYRGVWKGKEEMYQYAEGITTLGGKHIREGFVLKTTKERFEPSTNSRFQVKLLGEGYNLSKAKRK